MKKFRRVLLRSLAVIVALVVLVMGIRLVNGWIYRVPDGMETNPRDASQYALTQPGLKIERLRGDYLNGFHLKSDTPRHKGLVVVFGGSEGSPDYRRATKLANEGHEVLALFFFGQDNQQPELSRVPLEFFREALTWRSQHAPDGQLTVIGTSKGAELAMQLQARYPEIDNLVVFTPTRYTWAGLDFSVESSSWTWEGKDVPYISFRRASPVSTFKMFGAMLFAYPMRLREQYETAAQNTPDRDATVIPFRLKGNLLAFAGDQDAMWPGEVEARHLGGLAPGRTEAVVYPNAGHVFGPIGPHAGNVELGGTLEGNTAARDASDAKITQALAAWHR